MRNQFVIFLVTFFFFACQSGSPGTSGKAKQEIIQTENDFAKMAGEKGIKTAFLFYCDSNAIIKRGNDSLIIKKQGIDNFYSAPFYKNASLRWSADFADASDDGTLGYTYGKYFWQLKDSTGKTVSKHEGVFHTVWKKQKDGSWKFVWD
jgi:ketosteroid isomerase-like protein